MNREVHVRFWESPEVKVLRATRQTEKNSVRAKVFRIAPESGPCAIQLALRICTKLGRRHDMTFKLNLVERSVLLA